MLRITAVSAGGVDYLLRGCGCEVEAALAPAGPELAPGLGPAMVRGVSGAEYQLRAVEHGEAAGVWFGEGLEMLGREAGAEASAEDVRAVFGRLERPGMPDGTPEPERRLGRAPRTFKSVQERQDAALEAARLAEGDAFTPEREREIRERIAGDERKAVAYYDMTFSPVKSVSILHASLLAAGRVEEAQAIVDAHTRAAKLALAHLEEQACFVRTGYHGRTAEGRSVGRYEEARGLSAVLFQHSTSRESEPQLHTHAAVLNRAVTVSDGQIRALDGASFRPVKMAAAAVYERTLETLVSDALGVEWQMREDGKAREIVGVSPELISQGSTRRSQTTALAEEWLAQYQATHGRMPGAEALHAIYDRAALASRAPKSGEAGPAAVLEWASDPSRRALVEETILRAVDEPTWAREAAGLDVPSRELVGADLDRALRVAVATVQERYATWTIGALEQAISEQVEHIPGPAEDHASYLRTLAQQVLHDAVSYGVMTVSAGDSVHTPRELRRRDGWFVLRPHEDRVYATPGQLDAERALVAHAARGGAVRVDGEALEVLRERLDASTLTADQRAAVEGVLTSGRCGDVLIGPAGTGKSYTVGTLKGLWEDLTGGRVLGLATSQRAADVLREEGLEAQNTSVFLLAHEVDERTGEVRASLREGDLIVIDEAGMSSTAELERIAALAESAGAKLLYTGDMHQLGSVGAGGMLDLFARDTDVYELDAVRRFDAEWEREASLRLRVGDTGVIGEYVDRGRVHGGTLEEVSAEARRAWLADTVQGRESLLIVGSNDQAAQLSRSLREDLINLGRVDADPILGAILQDRNEVSVGDVIQARRNDRRIDVVGGRGMVVNRETYRVMGVDEEGRVIARGSDGATACLPADYLNEHATLAYAVTAHAAQGRTVDTSHAVLTEGASREDAYSAATRGRTANHVYVVSERTPDEHEPEALRSDPAAALAQILGTSTMPVSAELHRRTAAEDAERLAVLGTEWDVIAREHATARYEATLSAILTDEQMTQLRSDPAREHLISTVRAAELSGHRAERVIAAAALRRELTSADSIAQVLAWRVERDLPGRRPEQVVDPANWTTFAPPAPAGVGQWMQDIAIRASRRQARLALQMVRTQPQWAVDLLGEVPTDNAGRVEWQRRAGVVAAYRDLAGIADTQLSIGGAPADRSELHQQMWRQAQTAIGRPLDALEYATSSDQQLRENVARWERAQEWAPQYVADEIQASYEQAEQHRQDATVWAAQLATMDPTGPEHAETLEASQRAARLAQDAAERALQLEEIRDARQAWARDYEDVRVSAIEAAAELKRRGLDPHGDERAPEYEQVPLFNIDPPAVDEPTQEHRPEQARDVDEPTQEQTREQAPEPALEPEAAVDVAPEPAPEPTPVVEHEPIVEPVAQRTRRGGWLHRLTGALTREAEQAPVVDEPAPRAQPEPAVVVEVEAVREQAPAPEPESEPAVVVDEPARAEESVDRQESRRPATAREWATWARGFQPETDPEHEHAGPGQDVLFELDAPQRVGAEPLHHLGPDAAERAAEEALSLAQAREAARQAERIRAERQAARRRDQEQAREAERQAATERARQDEPKIGPPTLSPSRLNGPAREADGPVLSL